MNKRHILQTSHSEVLENIQIFAENAQKYMLTFCLMDKITKILTKLILQFIHERYGIAISLSVILWITRALRSFFYVIRNPKNILHIQLIFSFRLKPVKHSQNLQNFKPQRKFQRKAPWQNNPRKSDKLPEAGKY